MPKVNNTVIENISMTTTQETANKTLAGTFVGAGDGFHNAEGVAKLIQVGDGTNILRLENLKATRWMRLYMSTCLQTRLLQISSVLED